MTKPELRLDRIGEMLGMYNYLGRGPVLAVDRERRGSSKRRYKCGRNAGYGTIEINLYVRYVCRSGYVQ